MNSIGCSFEKYVHRKNISYNKVKCFTENKNHEVWNDRELLFWFAKDQFWVEIKELTKFSRLEYHSTKCRSDLQTFKHNVLENIGLQISVISMQQTPLLVSIGT